MSKLPSSACRIVFLCIANLPCECSSRFSAKTTSTMSEEVDLSSHIQRSHTTPFVGAVGNRERAEAWLWRSWLGRFTGSWGLATLHSKLGRGGPETMFGPAEDRTCRRKDDHLLGTPEPFKISKGPRARSSWMGIGNSIPLNSLAGTVHILRQSHASHTVLSGTYLKPIFFSAFAIFLLFSSSHSKRSQRLIISKDSSPPCVPRLSPLALQD
ncbi:hypothetical protein QBC44DRAFT_54162 [Cladorrhinum sp. PSN332]|nr:hypothetical protein QBC44DRAFT_54162 [Cladorrhinum sp. PSN332]